MCLLFKSLKNLKNNSKPSIFDNSKSTKNCNGIGNSAGDGFVYCHWCQTALIDWYEICPHCGMPIIKDDKKNKQ